MDPTKKTGTSIHAQTLKKTFIPIIQCYSKIIIIKWGEKKEIVYMNEHVNLHITMIPNKLYQGTSNRSMIHSLEFMNIISD